MKNPPCLVDVPSQPGTPDVAEVTDDHITLFWKAPQSDGLSPITNYKLEYHDKDEFLTWHTVNETTIISETTFTITNLQKGKDYNFKVTAINDIGPSKPSDPSAFIRIETPKKKEPPVIQEPLRNTSIGLKQTVTLSCVVSGVPKPDITWSKDGRTFKNKNQTFEACVAKYVINESHENSGGEYKVTAKNAAGEAETSCMLSIQEAPTLEIDERMTTQKLRVTNQWKVEVKVKGYPTPEIRWTKNKQTLESSKHCVIYTEDTSTSVAVYSLLREDSGTYEVVAKNAAGEARQQLNLRVFGKSPDVSGWPNLTRFPRLCDIRTLLKLSENHFCIPCIYFFYFSVACTFSVVCIKGFPKERNGKIMNVEKQA